MLQIVYSLSILLNFFLVSCLIVIAWNHRQLKKNTIRAAYEQRPLYVLHQGEIQGYDGDYHKIAIPELAKLYGLPIDRWIPANPRVPRAEWRKYYGEQAIHLYPLPTGINYRTYLVDVLQNGIRPDVPPMIIEEQSTRSISERQVTVMGDLYPNTLDPKYLLADDYLRVGTRVVAYNKIGKLLTKKFFRILSKQNTPLNHNVLGVGYLYTLSEKLPFGTSYLKISPKEPTYDK